MKFKTSFLFMLVLATQISKNSQACINEFHVNKAGKPYLEYEGIPNYNRGFDPVPIKEFLNKHDLKKLHSYDYKIQSDIAANLLKLGFFEEAQKILLSLYLSHPNDYTIAVNLGTAYELLGNNESALLLIKKGIQLNPESHNGSEWFHVKVLEAKIKIAKDNKWLLKNRVLNVKFQPASSENPKGDSLNPLYDINYQLHERIPFTPTPNLLMANILDEYGDLLATVVSIEHAFIMYKIAEQYDSGGVYKTSEKALALIPLLKKEEIKIPDYTRYFKYESEWNEKFARNKKNTEEYIKMQNKPEGRTKKAKPWVPFSIAAGIAFLAVFIIKRQRMR